MAWAPAYLTSDELKAFIRVTDTVDDVEVASAIEAASRAVDDHCSEGRTPPDRQFGQVAAPEARRYTARPRGCRWVVDIDDLMDAAGLTVAVPAGAITLYDLTPVNAAVKGRPWTQLVVNPDSTVQPTGEAYEVTVTARWGWSAVPVTVKNATKLQASRFLARRDSPYGVAGSPDQGSELRLLARVDPDVAVMLRPYVRRKWVLG